MTILLPEREKPLLARLVSPPPPILHPKPDFRLSAPPRSVFPEPGEGARNEAARGLALVLAFFTIAFGEFSGRLSSW